MTLEVEKCECEILVSYWLAKIDVIKNPPKCCIAQWAMQHFGNAHSLTFKRAFRRSRNKISVVPSFFQFGWYGLEHIGQKADFSTKRFRF
jgi:hypothetical protein